MTRNRSRFRRSRAPELTFAPLAWLKLQFFCHQGDTEIGGFGIAAEEDPLYVVDFQTVRQQVSSVTVRFSDDAVADFFEPLTATDRLALDPLLGELPWWEYVPWAYDLDGVHYGLSDSLTEVEDLLVH